MPWLKFHDGTDEDPDIDALSDGAFRFWFKSIAWSSRTLSDGHIPRRVVARWAPKRSTARRRWVELEEAGIWSPNGDGWEIRNFLKYQPSKSEVQHQREVTRKRVQRWRKQSKNGNAVTEGVTGEGCNASCNAAPVPTRPPPKGGEGRGGGFKDRPPRTTQHMTRAQYHAELARRAGLQEDEASDA